MEMIAVYVIVTIALLVFTDAGTVIGKIIKVPFYVVGHVILMIVAFFSMPLIIWRMAKAIKERDQQ